MLLLHLWLPVALGPRCSAAVLAQVALMHIAAFYLGHRLASATVAEDCLPRARAISLTTGMQARHGLT